LTGMSKDRWKQRELLKLAGYSKKAIERIFKWYFVN
jgi:hypothetical protein